MHLKTFAFGILPLVVSSLAAQTLSKELVASGLNTPLWVGSPPGDFDRIFVAEQSSGQIRIVENGAILPSPFLTQAVQTGSERGLLGVAFHPDFRNNGYVFVDYTRRPDGATMIARYRVSASNPDVVDPGSATTMFGPITQPYSNHNGGCIQFGPDGFLYIALGDGGSGGDPMCNAQNGQSLLGKVLRLDVDANPNGPAVPAASNPFVGNPGFRDEIWSYGLRNPWRFSFDRGTGDMWIGDVGQNTLEEVDFQPASSTGGENYGWKIKEGTNCYSSAACVNPLPCNSPLLVDPVLTMSTSTNCSVVGGYVYRGCAIPTLAGTYFYGDYCSGRIYSFEFVNGSVTNRLDRTAEVGAGSSVRSFGEDASGEILFCAGSSVYRIVPVGSLTNRVAGPGSVGSNGLTPIYEVCGLFGPNNTVTFRVRDAVPNAAVAVVFSGRSNPFRLPLPGFGTVVPNPIRFSITRTTDAHGVASYQFPSGGTVINVFHQCAVLDLGLGFPALTLSNALETLINAGPPPTIGGVSPLSAAAGTVIAISGSNFDPAATLSVGGIPAPPLTVTPTQMTFAYPATALPCDSSVRVTNPDGQFATAAFNPTPTVTGFFPTQGPAAGGTTVYVIGTGFAPGSTVTIGGTPATIVSASATVVTVVTPPGAPGPVQVLVTTPGGCSVIGTWSYR